MPTALNDLLKATSRSFYLTLRVLPARVRPPTGSAGGAADNNPR
jgi:phytoene/squalene synthetase